MLLPSWQATYNASMYISRERASLKADDDALRRGAATAPTVRTQQGFVRGVALADAHVDIFRGILLGEACSGSGFILAEN